MILAISSANERITEQGAVLFATAATESSSFLMAVEVFPFTVEFKVKVGWWTLCDVRLGTCPLKSMHNKVR